MCQCPIRAPRTHPVDTGRRLLALLLNTFIVYDYFRLSLISSVRMASKQKVALVNLLRYSTAY